MDATTGLVTYSWDDDCPEVGSLGVHVLDEETGRCRSCGAPDPDAEQNKTEDGR